MLRSVRAAGGVCVMNEHAAGQVLVSTGPSTQRFIPVNADKADAHVAIVSELAVFQPFDVEGFCVFCFSADPHGAPSSHEPECLWRRARELYPKTVSDG